jgi:hypothetical protein
MTTLELWEKCKVNMLETDQLDLQSLIGKIKVQFNQNQSRKSTNDKFNEYSFTISIN